MNVAPGSGATNGVANATLNFSVSQTLGSLTIGAGAPVALTSDVASLAGSGSLGGGSTALPEPGTIGLLLMGAVGVLSRRRRQA